MKYVAGLHQGWVLPAEALCAVPGFAARFQSLLSAGYSWINLSAYGLFGGVLTGFGKRSFLSSPS